MPQPVGQRDENPAAVLVVLDDSTTELHADPHDYRYVAGRRTLSLLRGRLRHGEDRLARTVQDQLRLAHAFEAAGATLVVGPEGVEFSPAAEFTQAIVSVMHHLVHGERSEAAKRGWAKRRARQMAG